MNKELVPKMHKNSNFCGRFFLFFLFFIFLNSSFLFAADEVKFKVLAVNPSQTKPIKAEISQPLPPEVNPATDLIDATGLKVVYDGASQSYNLAGEVELAPRETKTLIVRVRDVWRIPPETIDEVKKNLEEQIQALKETKYSETAQMLYEKAQATVDLIVEEQERPVGIKQHIEFYRAHVRQLEDIKENALSLGAMRQLQEEQKKGVHDAKYLIEAENPSAEAKKMTVRAVMPKEIKSEDILDKLDFNVLYDQTQRSFILEKNEEFAARENKKYIITLRDVWRVPDADIDFAEEQTNRLAELFKGSSYEKYAASQGDTILEMLKSIKQLQNELADSLSLEDRMRGFVLNTQQMNLAKAKLRNLHQLLQDIPIAKGDENIFEKIREWVKKLADVKDVVLMALGIQPDRPTTWWIILGIVAFLATLVTVFYFIWIKLMQKNKFAPSKEVMEAKKTIEVDKTADEANKAEEESNEG